MNFIISTDSCLDLLKDQALKQKINVLPMTVIKGENTFKDDFSSLKEYENFYKELSSGQVFKTASLNSVELSEHFEKLLKSGKDVLHFSLSSGLSVTYDVAKETADKFNAKNNNKVYVIDTLSATQGQNMLVQYAVKLRDAGEFPHAVYNKILELVKKMSATFFVTDFDCLKRGGRVSGAQAVIGKMMGIRPVLDIDTEGKLRVISKVIGNKKALHALLNKLDDYDEKANLPIYIPHSGNYDAVEELEKMIKLKFPMAEITKNYIGPTIGAHTGQGTLGLVFLSKKERVWWEIEIEIEIMTL